jgi:hypothetical protein
LCIVNICGAGRLRDVTGYSDGIGFPMRAHSLKPDLPEKR